MGEILELKVILVVSAVVWPLVFLWREWSQMKLDALIRESDLLQQEIDQLYSDRINLMGNRVRLMEESICFLIEKVEKGAY